MYNKDITRNLKPESKLMNLTRGAENVIVTEFKSLQHLMQYIQNNHNNEPFGGKSSGPRFSDRHTKPNDCWYGDCQNLDEAFDKLVHGYEVGAMQLVKSLKAEKSDSDVRVRKLVQDLVGYQAIVPNYLMGIPQNMVNCRTVVQKKKIITLNKCIDYSASVSASQILEYSTQTLRIIQSLEKQGYSINLNILDGYDCGNKEIIKVRIKSAGEKLNVNKLAFPLLHPSMLRRIMFRYVEISDTTQYRTTWANIGSCVYGSVYKDILAQQNEIYLDRAVTEKDIDKVVLKCNK